MKKIYFLLAVFFAGIHFWGGVLYALPQGGKVGAGEVVLSQSQDSLTITQDTDRAIINWNQFNIDTNELVHFTQPDSNAVTLNRITGGDPSSILGSLTANGSIFLVNPSGVFFGPNAMVDVGGLVATTIDIKDDDFLAGIDRFQETGMGTGFVANQGKIKVSDGGFVFFIAPAVENSGVIVANGGEVLLDARGAADPLSLMVNQSGIIEAKSLVNEGGTIRLVGSTVIETGTLDVSGVGNSNAGNIVIWSDKNTIFNGTLLARGGEAGGNGGSIEVSGLQGLQFNGVVNASAVNGIAGHLLLDPKNIIIENGGGDSFSANDPFGENAEGTARIDADKITAVTNNGTGVTLQANNDIIVNEQIVTRTPDVLVDGVLTHINPGGALKFQAGRSILINANITSDNASITLTANDTAAIDSNRDQGSALINMASGTTLNAGGANIVITLSTGSGTGKDGSGAITLADLITTHNIEIVNNGPSPSSDILRASSSSLVSAASVAFDIMGSGGSIGTASAPIRIAVSNVEARSQSGSVFLASTKDVTVGSAELADHGVSGITSAGPLTLSVAGNLIVNEAITTQGDILLHAQGADKTITNTAAISSMSNAPITLRADRMALERGTINSDIGRVTLIPETSGRVIDLGSETDVGNGLELSNAEMNRIITSGVLHIGAPDAGPIDISAPINTAKISTLILQGGSVTQKNPLIEENLRIESTGNVILGHPNDIDTMSANITSAGKEIRVTDIDDLVIGTVDTTKGIQTNNGAITVTTQSNLTIESDLVAGTASISLTADAPEKRITNNAVIRGGEIILSADQMVLAANSTIDGGASRVTLQSDQGGRAIDLGRIDDPANLLALSDSELDTIKTTGTLQIGDSNTGGIIISSPIDTNGVKTTTLIGQGPIKQTQPIVEENLRIVSEGPVVLTDTKNNVGTLTATVTGPGNPIQFTDVNRVELGTVDGATGITINGGSIEIVGQIGLAESIERHFRSGLLPIGEGVLNRFYLSILPQDFVALPESPCKLDALLSNEVGLQGGC